MVRDQERFFAMVLDYYRAPLMQIPSVDVRHPIPEGFSTFLDYLARPDDRLSKLADGSNLKLEELLTASYFYIRQLLFSDECDHYRVLGLSRDAGIEEIRRRYRLLIGLFHPDRITTDDQREEHFVRRLNQAYTVLKRPEKRRVYDQELNRLNNPRNRPVSSRGRSVRSVRRAKFQPNPVSGRPTEILYRSRLLQKYPKFFVWAVILLVLGWLILVSLISSRKNMLQLEYQDSFAVTMFDPLPNDPYPSDSLYSDLLSNRRISGDDPGNKMANKALAETTIHEIPEAQESLSNDERQSLENNRVESGKDLPGQSDNSASAPFDDTSTMEIEVTGAVSSAEGVMVGAVSSEVSKANVVQPIRVSNRPEKRVRVAAPGMSHGKSVQQLPATKSFAADAAARPMKALQTIKNDSDADKDGGDTESMGFDGAMVPSLSILELAGDQTGRKTTKYAADNLQLAGLQPEYVLMQYVKAYESGDMNRLLGLFTLNPKSNAGSGRDLIRESYNRVFHELHERQINVRQIRIGSVGTDDFQITILVDVSGLAKGADDKSKFQGEIQFRLIRKGKKLYIASLLHNVRRN